MGGSAGLGLEPNAGDDPKVSLHLRGAAGPPMLHTPELTETAFAAVAAGQVVPRADRGRWEIAGA